jgi:hypothetical protein
LLVHNRFAIDRGFRVLAAVITVLSLVHTTLRWLQAILYGGALARTKITEPPLFIIGHWRSGTTLLHELLSLDEQHTCPTTYACLAPHHFLLTERWVACWCKSFAPMRRPMDDMAAGWERPQEDEFALCMLGLPSPYLTVAFPNRPPQCREYGDLEDLSPRALAQWERAYLAFLRQLTFWKPGRLILKSPLHTLRIKVLLKLFPNARFVHIVRNPYVVFSSTLTMWKALYRTQALQRPTFDGLEEEVYRTFVHLDERLEEARGLVAPSRFFEIRYEDLVRDPVGQVRAMYDWFGLGEFERALPRLRDYLNQIAGYKTNWYHLSSEQAASITQRWGTIIGRYGYTPPDESGAAGAFRGE